MKPSTDQVLHKATGNTRQVQNVEEQLRTSNTTTNKEETTILA
jgi:hypothetical protein